MSNKLGVAIFGAGYVGSNLFKTLQILDKSEQFLINRGMIDYTNELKLRSFIETCKPDVIVNCVGFTGKPNVDACELNKAETYKLNVQLPILMAKLCEFYNIDFYHISSGCIYSGYEKKYSEKDEPDFGVYNPKSSFYSMTKHAAELNLANFAKTKILRIRMPFCGERNQRNYLMKIRNYDNLLNATNSKTHIPRFCEVLSSLIINKDSYMPKYTLNVCNPEPLSTPEIIDIYRKHGFDNPNWKLIKYEELPIKANRSNCIMDTTKLTKEFNFSFPTEAEAITKSIVSLRDNA
jgi:dTDP-4-dehydrorhamnose reductase